MNINADTSLKWMNRVGVYVCFPSLCELFYFWHYQNLITWKGPHRLKKNQNCCKNYFRIPKNARTSNRSRYKTSIIPVFARDLNDEWKKKSIVNRKFRILQTSQLKIQKKKRDLKCFFCIKCLLQMKKEKKHLNLPTFLVKLENSKKKSTTSPNNKNKIIVLLSLYLSNHTTPFSEKALPEDPNNGC